MSKGKMFKTDQVVAVSLNHLEAWETIKKILEPYAYLLDRMIVVDNPHGAWVAPEESEDKLIIHFWSTPKRSTGQSVGTRYGVDLTAGQRDSLAPVVMEGVINLGKDEDNGSIAAQVVNSTLYILFDLPHSGHTIGIKTLLTQIMEEFVHVWSLKLKAEDYQAFEEFERRRAGLNEYLYVDFQRRQIQRLINEHQTTIKEASEVVSDLHRKIMNWQRKRVDSAVQAEALRLVLEDFDEAEAIRQVRDLAEFSERELVFDADEIRINVGQVDIEFGGQIYDIGEFEVRIEVDEGEEGVQCFNLTREVDDYFHPHISNDGRCCFGNIEAAVTQLVAEREYSALMQLVIEFLKTATKDSWFKEVTAWPEKEETADGE